MVLRLSNELIRRSKALRPDCGDVPSPCASRFGTPAWHAVLLVSLMFVAGAAACAAETSVTAAIAEAQPKMVKIYGAGGVRGLEAYQSGFLISAEGHILTVWSYVLDTDYIGIILSDGRKYEAKLVGADPKMELAVLKIEAEDLSYFNLADAAVAEPATRVLAFSNLFGVATGDEPDSVQHGVVSATTRLDARRGAFATPYRGAVYVVDAMTNNPGAAGGALTTQDGRLLAMLGKEMRSALSNTWLNYAVPIGELQPTVAAILSGKERPADKAKRRPASDVDLASYGLIMVPDVLERTPPYVDEVLSGSAAATAGIQTDDLVLFVGDQIVQSCKALQEELAQLDADSEAKLVLMRGQELVTVTLKIQPIDPANERGADEDRDREGSDQEDTGRP